MNKPAGYGLIVFLAAVLTGCGPGVDDAETADYGQSVPPTIALTVFPDPPVISDTWLKSTEEGRDPTPEELAEDAQNYIDPADYDRINAAPIGDPNTDSPYFSTTTTTTTTTTVVTTTSSTVPVTSTTLSPTTTIATTSTSVPCTFSGFFDPVDNAPVVNVVNAGAAVPVKFGYCQSGSLAIFASGSPTSASSTCGTSGTDDIESTVAVSTSGLRFDAASGRYQYNWKTDKTWTGQCRTLTLEFTNGTTQTAKFRFK